MPLSIAVVPPALVSSASATDARANCEHITPRFARSTPDSLADRAKPRLLGQEPPANLVLALFRRVEGCNAPIVVRYGIGANADGK